MGLIMLKLVSNDGATVKGWPDDPIWEGWIPVHAVQFSHSTPSTVNWSGGSGVERKTGLSKDLSLSIKMEDVDGAALANWTAQGIIGTATIDLVADAVGGQGSSLVYSEAAIVSVSFQGNLIHCTLNFKKMDYRISVRYR